MNSNAATEAAQLQLDSSYFVVNMSQSQLSLIKENLESVVSTLPMTNHRLERQFGLLYGIGAMLFNRYNCINNNPEKHVNMNKNNTK